MRGSLLPDVQVRANALPMLLLLLAPPPVASQQPMEEYQALARLIHHFMALVTWPKPPDQELTVAVIGGDPFQGGLDVLLKGSTVGGRAAKVRFLTQSAFLANPGAFDAVFIDRGEAGRLPTLLAAVKGRPILTMGYGEGLGSRGLMVAFFIDEGRPGFEVNPGRLKEAGLQVNSRLMKLAKIVEG